MEMSQSPVAEAGAMLGLESAILCLQQQAAKVYHLIMS